MKLRLVGVSVLACVLTLAAGQSTLADAAGPELLAIVKAGCSNALASVHSGKGKVTVSCCMRAPDATVLQQGRSVYDVVFRGDKFKMSRTGYPQVIDAQNVAGSDTSKVEMAYDGATVVKLIDRGRPRATVSSSTKGKPGMVVKEYRSIIGVEGNGLMDIDNCEIPPPGSTKVGPRVIGTESIDGTDCIVVEVVYETPDTADFPMTKWHLSWVAPSKGYTVLKRESWCKNLVHEEKHMTGEKLLEVRDYGNGVWGPAKIVHNEYRIDKETGTVYKQIEEVITYDPAFELNAQVSDNALTLDMPSKTRVDDEVLGVQYTVP